MPSLPQVGRRVLTLVALLGCVPLLLADSDEEPCKALTVDQTYDVVLTCPADQSYTTRVRFAGSFTNLDSMRAQVESGPAEGLDVTLEGSCSGSDTIASSILVSFSVVTDKAGNRYVYKVGQPPMSGTGGAGAGGQGAAGSAGAGGQPTSETAGSSGSTTGGTGSARPEVSSGLIRTQCRTPLGALGRSVACESYDNPQREPLVVEGCRATVTLVP